MKIIKILIINLLIFVILILFVEILFGGWFKKNNFGYVIRDLRNIKLNMSVKYNEEIYNYTFKRNNLGFIGENLDPKEIKIIFIGGSTGEEMFKPYEYTIVGQLNKKIKNDGINLKIINASKAGKTTRGYIYDFKYWFTKIENLDPKIFIFYTGINDSSLTLPKSFDQPFKKAFLEKVEDYIKNNSFIYYIKKKLQNKYFNKTRKNYGLENKDLYSNYNFVDYNLAKMKFSDKELTLTEKTMLQNFSKNLEQLKKILLKKNFKAIFITQIQYDGLNNKNLFLINEFLKEFCKKNNYEIIKLDELNYKLENKDFYDQVHTTINGSKKISDLIYPELKKYLSN